MTGTARFAAGVLGFLAALAVGRPAEEGAKEAGGSKPPWQRYLQGDDARKAAEQETKLDESVQAGDFAEAVKVAEGLAELRRKVQGADHWQAVNACWVAAAYRSLARQGEEVRKEYIALSALETQSDTLRGRGRYREAQAAEEKMLAFTRQVLGEEHPITANCYSTLAGVLADQGKYAEAREGFHKALAIRRKLLGEDHPKTATSYSNLAAVLDAQGKYAEAEDVHRRALAIRRKALGEDHLDLAYSYYNLGRSHYVQGKYAQAEESYRKALAIRRKKLGEEHRDTLMCSDRLAATLASRGKYAEAEEEHRKVLAICRKVLSEDHPQTAASHNNLGTVLEVQGKHVEAEESFRKALAISRKVLSEEHPLTVTSYNNLAGSLNLQGKHVEAEEGHRKALAIRRKALGEEHPQTAVSYNSLAVCQSDQGKYAEAVEGHRKALAIYRKVLGEQHPDTVQTYNVLAADLRAQGGYAEAQECIDKALAICRKDPGEENLATAASYTNLALNLRPQGRYAEAEEGFRKALAIHCKTLGEENSQTAQSYSNLAVSLDAQGKYAEAEEGHRKALGIARKALGEAHILVARTYSNLAWNQNAQGKYEQAEQLWRRAAEIFARGRLSLAGSGLERAAVSKHAPFFSQAAVLARNGKSEEAWQRFEEGLARGTWDDLTARRPAAVRARQAQLIARVDRLNKLIERPVAGQAASPPAGRRDELLTQLRQALGELADFRHQVEKTYGPVAGLVFGREQIQAALPPDAALVSWLDIPGPPRAKDPNGEHWAMLLRRCGDPVWVRLPGSGDNGAWTDADSRLPKELYSALQSPRGRWQPIAGRLLRQRLQPLSAHLKGVRHLVVLPSPALAGVPVEVIAAGSTVSYAPSGTIYAHLRRQPAAAGKGLFALADPVFDAPRRQEKPPPLPPGGVLLTAVLPGSNAARAGLRPNDVLLRYGDRELAEARDLELSTKTGGSDRPVPVLVWRDGRRLARPLFVPPGRLGVVVATEPAPQALAEQRRLDRVLSSRGGEDGKWERLPGTRAEAAALERLFAGEPTRLLLESEAGEQRLDELAEAGELGKYRYLHLATHGEVDNTAPLRSALILSRDRLPDEKRRAELLLAGRPIPDGRLTAEEVLRRWELHCELVTLSACQSALGKYERSEGFVGFAQALILAGSRSVCLSLWKVDDTATALLMERFYQNLLGKREGLTAPLGKAEALAEARAWLRGLTYAEATKHVARLGRGKPRGEDPDRGKGPALPVPAAPPAAAGDAASRDHPFAHPYYWAAFVLVCHAD